MTKIRVVIVSLACFSLGCNSLRLFSNGAIPDVPSGARVLLVTQYAEAQRFILPVTQAFRLIGIQPHIE